MVFRFVRDLAWFAAGNASWPLIEYGIHGVLSHRLRTPVGAMHARHHEDPRAVFTPPIAWIPVFSLLAATSMGVLGPRAGGAFALGTLAGFVRYERFHHRIHFAAPRDAREQALFEHHMAHHYLDGSRAHGVTTDAIDRLLGTMPVRGVRQRRLTGTSNFREVYSFAGSVRAITTARERLARTRPVDTGRASVESPSGT